MTEPERPRFFTRKAFYDYLWRVASTLTAAAVASIYLRIVGVIHIPVWLPVAFLCWLVGVVVANALLSLYLSRRTGQPER